MGKEMIRISVLAAAVLTNVAAIAADASQASEQPGAQAHTLPAGVIATVNGVAITQTQCGAVLRESGQPDTPAARQMIKQGLIARELIRQAVEAENLSDAPQVKSATGKARVDAENRLYLAAHLDPDPVADAQVRARYDVILAEMGAQEYKARVITLPSDEAARAALARLRSGVPFETVAAESSIAPSGVHGGELPWVSFKTPPAEGHTTGLPLAISTLNVGEVSNQPIAVDNVRMIVKLDTKRATVIPSYEEIKPTLRQSLDADVLDHAFQQLVA